MCVCVCVCVCESMYMVNGEASAYHHDDEPQCHDDPGNEAISRVPTTVAMSG